MIRNHPKGEVQTKPHHLCLTIDVRLYCVGGALVPKIFQKAQITHGSFIGYPGSSTYSTIQMVILHTLHADV